MNDRCPKCHQPLFCQGCNTFPTHRPHPKQAIGQLFGRAIRDKPAEFFELASEIRNSIMHGEDVSTIEASRNVRLGDVVDVSGRVAWASVLDEMIRDPEGRKRLGTLAVLQPNRYTRQVLTLTAHLIVSSSDPSNPRLSEIAEPTIGLMVSDEPKPT